MADAIGKRHDATGRSTGEIVHYGGRAKRWKFEEAFVGEPASLLGSPGYQALNFPAFKILAFLKLEHVRHGGAENGRLLAPHRQLQALGIGPRHIKPALAMLEAFGIIRVTTGGVRLGGRPNAARYALTWLPTCDGQLPTDDYRTVTRADVREYLGASKKTDAAPLKAGGAPTQGKATEVETGAVDYPKEGATACLKEGTIYILGGSASLDGVAGRGAEPSNSAATRPAPRAGSPERLPKAALNKNCPEIASTNDRPAHHLSQWKERA